jgi:pullulanase/glycogen debranching enzyme
VRVIVASSKVSGRSGPGHGPDPGPGPGRCSRPESAAAPSAPWRLAVYLAIAAATLASGPAAPAGEDRAPREQARVQAILSGVEDRAVRRTLLDRFRRRKLDIEGLETAAAAAAGRGQVCQQAPAPGSAPEAPARAPGATGSARPLGATLDPDGASTTFRVFAPRAISATVHTYGEATTGTGKRTPMAVGPEGIWEASVRGANVGTYYDFTVDGPAGAGELFDRDRHLSDPYARANVNHDGRSLVVDGRFDWARTSAFRPPSIRDAIVYEMHVKDWTAHRSSGVTDPARRGRFLGLTDGAGTDRLMGHLTQLGVNAVELLPVHEFDNKAAPPGHINHWGYMTTHFFAPECSYATGDRRGEGVRELKAAIRAFHENGIAVILDVVYNHTAEGDQAGPVLNLKGLDNPYYYRLTQDRLHYMNGTGCGNELRTESPMTRRLVIDSLRQFAAEYRVDGFRLDLGASLDKETMFAIEEALPRETILIAEPWTADWSRKQWVKEDMRGRRWALWNDGYRDALRTFVNGNARRDDVITAAAGSCLWWAGRPVQSVNYLECHDGHTLHDLLAGDARKNRLSAVALFTSQGVPMIQAGQEFLRTKKGNDNSYDQDNEINWIDWTLKSKNRAVFDFYAGLIAIRKRFPALRHDDCLTDRDVEWLRPAGDHALGYLLRAPHSPGVLVLLNSHPTEWITCKLPARGAWPVLCNGELVALDGVLGTAAGDYRVPPVTGVILRSP